MYNIFFSFFVYYDIKPLKEGLKKTYEWYVKNEQCWKPLINDKFFKEDEPWKK